MAAYWKFLAIVLVFGGEAVSIYAEMVSAKEVASGSLVQIFLKSVVLITIAGAFLIGGYMLGLSVFENIWVVSVISITSILMIEPLLAWHFFKELPTRGAVIGFFLGAAGFLSTIFL